ncbi:hypothetical protein HDV05_001998, partial [Chytridiales sp. JEL 0842]
MDQDQEPSDKQVKSTLHHRSAPSLLAASGSLASSFIPARPSEGPTSSRVSYNQRHPQDVDNLFEDDSRVADAGQYHNPSNHVHGIDPDFLPATRLENGNAPTKYLQTVFDRINATAVVANQMDAVTNKIPKEVTDLIAKETQFFFPKGKNETMPRPRGLSGSYTKLSKSRQRMDGTSQENNSGHNESAAVSEQANFRTLPHRPRNGRASFSGALPG